MYQQTWPKVVESTSVNLSGLTTVIQTHSVALVWINQRPKKNLLNLFSNHTPMLGQKTHSGPIQMPSSVSFPWSNCDFFHSPEASIPNNLTASNYETILTLGLGSMHGIAHTFNLELLVWRLLNFNTKPRNWHWSGYVCHTNEFGVCRALFSTCNLEKLHQGLDCITSRHINYSRTLRQFYIDLWC